MVKDERVLVNCRGGVRAVRVCGICGGETADMVADHCHETGVVRDWVCRSCNAGLGMFKDRPEVLRAAADYLERHRAHPKTRLVFLREELGKLRPRSYERRAAKVLAAEG